MIEVGKTYKYKELCELMVQSIKSGKSKQLQLKDWKRFFEWENPTSQKYVITKVYDTPLEKIDNRGKTEKKLVDEFPILWDDFMQQSWNGSIEEYCNNVYFSYGRLAHFFGFYNDKYNNVRELSLKELKKIDPAFDLVVYNEITEKIRSLVYSWVINKIKKDKRVNYGYGVLGQRYKHDEKEQLDEFLKKYEELQALWMEKNKYKHMAQVIQKKQYHLMYLYVKKHLNEYISKNNDDGIYPENGYAEIQRLHKIHTHKNQTFQKYDKETVQQARYSVNKQLCNALNEYYSKRWDKWKESYKEIDILFDCGMSPELDIKYTNNRNDDLESYKHIIDTYVKISD